LGGEGRVSIAIHRAGHECRWWDISGAAGDARGHPVASTDRTWTAARAARAPSPISGAPRSSHPRAVSRR